MLLRELRPCPYRKGVVIRGKAHVLCELCGESYPVDDIIYVCKHHCPVVR